MPALFSVDNLNVSYDTTPVLRDVSFHIRRGEFVGIIGPNGSGKSTLLRTMAGAMHPVSGYVALEGHEVFRMSGRWMAERVAVVPQDNSVAFDYTLLEIVLMGRSPHLGRFEVERRSDLEIATDALKRTNLLHLADRRITALSGGERQRAMIARALAQRADTIFLDEPTAHLDINYQVEILHLVKRQNVEDGKTVVVVLHDLNLAAEFCDRLLMLAGGRVFADGTPEEVVTAANVQKVYGTTVWVRRHPTSGRPYVLSVGSRGIAARLAGGAHPVSGPKVHVICGGGSGMPVFAGLLEEGCEVTAGVINIGDSDQEAAESLGIEYVEESPFSRVSDAARKANAEFISRADAVVVAETPFGQGNMSNLESALEASQQGKRVALIGAQAGFPQRDFADGKVTELLNRLVDGGASVLESPDDVTAWIAKTRGE